MLPSIPPPNSSPLPRDFEALRVYNQESPSSQLRGPSVLLRQLLTPRLLDLFIFNGVDLSRFEDWRLRIENKLVLNANYYSINIFKVEYVILRLTGKAV